MISLAVIRLYYISGTGWFREGDMDMRIHTYGEKDAPVVIMLPGSFCNADTMANIIAEL